jgi:predicted alpha-1,2-mannosidase
LIDDLIRQTQQSPYGPLVWPLQGKETGTMIGWHGVVPIAEAHAKGIPADYAAAWPAIAKRSFDFSAPDQDNSKGRDLYDKLGYVPADKWFESVSRTQEYAYDDWASSHLARAAGATADAERLLKRSHNWRNVLDPSIRFARPRFSDGSWWSPYDPVQLGHMPKPWWRDYTEANGWQATFLNQHDIYGLIEHFGGDAAFEARLDSFFSAPSTLPANAPPDISGLVGQYAHGNEPDQHAPYLYAYVGAPWKTQRMVRRLLTEMYKAAPDGMIGNDDCGQMSAWFVLSALGFYPVDPVSAVYVFGSPLFDRAEVSVGGGRRLIVEAPGNGPGRPYVQSVLWNGRPWSKSWIAHRDIVRGGTLTFRMGAEPNRNFGRARDDRPPSFGHGAS